MLSTVGETEISKVGLRHLFFSPDNTNPVIYAECHISVTKKQLMGRQQSLPDALLTRLRLVAPADRWADRPLDVRHENTSWGLLCFVRPGDSHLQVLLKWTLYLLHPGILHGSYWF